MQCFERTPEPGEIECGALGQIQPLARVIAELGIAQPDVAPCGLQPGQSPCQRAIDRARHTGQAAQLQIQHDAGFEAQDALSFVQVGDFQQTLRHVD